MKKKTKLPMTNVDPVRQRRLELARATVRTLSHDELLNAVGGETGCASTTTPTQTKLTNHR
jgi:hypothetical protein